MFGVLIFLSYLCINKEGKETPSITNKNAPGNDPGKKMTDIQIKERVENLGGTISEDGTQALFSFDEDISSDNGETITLKEAVNIERQMMDLGFDGALIGTAFNEGDLKGIYFQIH